MPAKEADQFFSPFYYGQTNPPKNRTPTDGVPSLLLLPYLK
jgi:hypothetical protein